MGAGLLSPTHLIFLAILALLLFGAKRLPEMARSLGTGLHEFKASVTGLEQHEGNSSQTAAVAGAPAELELVQTPPAAEPPTVEKAVA